MNREHFELTTWGLNQVTIDPSYVILDVGCGGGKTINRLSQLVPQGKAYGIDYSPDMVTYAKKVNKKLIEENKIEIKEASVDNTCFAADTFDLITAVETYYFWPSLPDAFKEIYRILKPNGALLMINEMIKDGVYEVEKAALIKKVHVQLYSLDELLNMLEVAGFRVGVFRKEGSAWNALVAQKSKV